MTMFQDNFTTIEFHALGALNEMEEIRKLKREKGVTKCSGDLTIMEVLSLNRSDTSAGRVPVKKDSRITIVCSLVSSGILRMPCLTNKVRDG